MRQKNEIVPKFDNSNNDSVKRKKRNEKKSSKANTGKKKNLRALQVQVHVHLERFREYSNHVTLLSWSLINLFTVATPLNMHLLGDLFEILGNRIRAEFPTGQIEAMKWRKGFERGFC